MPAVFTTAVYARQTELHGGGRTGTGTGTGSGSGSSASVGRSVGRQPRRAERERITAARSVSVGKVKDSPASRTQQQCRRRRRRG